MTPEHLAYYLRGFAETASEPPTPGQWGVLRHTILLATAEQAHVSFGGNIPPEIAALMGKGCKACTPKGGTPPPPVIDDTLI